MQAFPSVTSNEYLLQKERHAAFQHLFTANYASLTYFAQRIVNDKESAEDIVMDAFVKLWYVGTNLHHPAASKSFLYTTIRHACVDLLRQQKSRERSKTEIAYLSNKQERLVLDDMIRAEVLQAIQIALQALPPKCRRVFQLFYLERKSIKEIAEELQVSVNTIKTQKARALLLLKEKLPYSSLLLLFCYCPFIIV